MEAVIQRQRANYARFRKLFRAARKLDHIYLNDADKSRLGLVVYPLDYQSDKRATVPGQLQFFEPMQSDVFHGLPGPDFTAVPDSVDIGLIRSLSFAVDTYNHLVEVFPEEKKPSPNEFSLISSTKWELSSLVFSSILIHRTQQNFIYFYLFFNTFTYTGMKQSRVQALAKTRFLAYPTTSGAAMRSSVSTKMRISRT